MVSVGGQTLPCLCWCVVTVTRVHTHAVPTRTSGTAASSEPPASVAAAAASATTVAAAAAAASSAAAAASSAGDLSSSGAATGSACHVDVSFNQLRDVVGLDARWPGFGGTVVSLDVRMNFLGACGGVDSLPALTRLDASCNLLIGMRSCWDSNAIASVACV